MKDIAGAFPVLPTIFDDAGEIDSNGMANVVEWVIGCGCDGVVFPGLASEYDMLALDERLTLIAAIGERTAGRVDFVAGCSGQSDAESAALIAAAERAGAAAAMIVTPARKGDDLDAIGDFYAGLADAALAREPAEQAHGDRVRESADFAEGVAAFREKRQPRY